METQAQLLDLSVGWAPVGFEKFGEAKKLGYPCAEYAGVYAVKDGQILSAVRVLRLPYTTRHGIKKVAGIQGVVTRRDNGRKGLARKLLLDVHQREKAAGCDYSMLWTGRGLVAHSLYEGLGYRDVYTPDLASVRKERRDRGQGRYALKAVQNDDIPALEELHDRVTAGRLGFTPRPHGMIQSVIHLGLLATESLRTIYHARQLVGYAVLQKHPTWCSLEVLCLNAEASVGNVLRTLEGTTDGSWFVIRNTVVKDMSKLLEMRGYQYSSFAYYTLLALPLGEPVDRVEDELGTGTSRFTCQALDYF